MKKWMIYTLGFFYFDRACAVGTAGFREGITQSASFEKYALQAWQNGDAQRPFFDDNFRGGGRHGFDMRGGHEGSHMGGSAAVCSSRRSSV